MSAGRRLIVAMASAVTLFAWTAYSAAPVAESGPRKMEKLGRGVVAVRTEDNKAFISWRLLGLDPADIKFNVYRSANGATPVKLNGTPLGEGTNYLDSNADLSKANAYHVPPRYRRRGTGTLRRLHTPRRCCRGAVVPDSTHHPAGPQDS